MPYWVNEAAAGLLPHFFSEHDPRPAKDQIAENYAHGGGWRPIHGFRMTGDPKNPETLRLSYPGDPPFKAVAWTVLPASEKHDAEIIVLFHPADVVAVIQENGDYAVTRMD